MKNVIAFVLTVLTIQGFAQKIKVLYDHTDDMELSQYKTYKFEKLEITSIPERPVRQEAIDVINQSIIDQMTQRGFELVEEDPDIIINMGITIERKDQTRETDFITDRPLYMGQRNYHWESEEIVVDQYQEGTLVMDMVDTEMNELIWQANAISVLHKESKPKRIENGIDKLFRKFPVKPN